MFAWLFDCRCFLFVCDSQFFLSLFLYAIGVCNRNPGPFGKTNCPGYPAPWRVAGKFCSASCVMSPLSMMFFPTRKQLKDIYPLSCLSDSIVAGYYPGNTVVIAMSHPANFCVGNFFFFFGLSVALRVGIFPWFPGGFRRQIVSQGYSVEFLVFLLSRRCWQSHGDHKGLNHFFLPRSPVGYTQVCAKVRHSSPVWRFVRRQKRCSCGWRVCRPINVFLNI